MHYGVALFSSWSKSICDPKTSMTKIRAPKDCWLPFQDFHLERAQTSQPAPISPKGKPLGSHMVGQQFPVHPDTPTMIGWTTGGRVHQKSSALKVAHPSTILSLCSLTLEFP